MRRGPVLLALALLAMALVVDAWDWWTAHDLEVLGRVRQAPAVGRSVERALGAVTLRPELSIAVDASYPPFASVEADGRLVGFEVDLGKELGRRLAERVALVNMDGGDAAFEALAARKVDAILAGLTYYPEGARETVFSSRYFEAGPLLMARIERADLREARDLKGKRVAVEVGSAGEEEARKLQRSVSGMELLRLQEVDRVLDAVAEGAADAVVMDRPSIPPGSPIAARLRQVGPPLRSVPYMVAVRRQDRPLLLAINRELEAMKAEGLLVEMEKRWLN